MSERFIDARELARRIEDLGHTATVSWVGNSPRDANSVSTNWLIVWPSGDVSIYNKMCDPKGTPPVPLELLQVVTDFCTDFKESVKASLFQDKVGVWLLDSPATFTAFVDYIFSAKHEDDRDALWQHGIKLPTLERTM